jgi:energy-converting hydrogenase Eha subunit A
LCIVSWRAWVPIDSEFNPIMDYVSWVTTVCRQTIVIVSSITVVFRSVLGLTSLGSLLLTVVGIWAWLLVARHIQEIVLVLGLGLSVVVLGDLGVNSELLVHGVRFWGMVTEEWKTLGRLVGCGDYRYW